MNPEHSPAERAGKHATIRDPESDLALDFLLDHIAESNDDAARLEQLVREHGVPLLAYVLTSRDHEVGLQSDTLETRFEYDYFGSYDSLDHIFTDFREAMGWDDSLERAGIPEALLQWDEVAFAGWLEGYYLVIYLEAELHLFNCPPRGEEFPQH